MVGKKGRGEEREGEGRRGKEREGEGRKGKERAVHLSSDTRRRARSAFAEVRRMPSKLKMLLLRTEM